METLRVQIPGLKCEGQYGSSRTVLVQLRLIADKVQATCPCLGRMDGVRYRCANYRSDAGTGVPRSDQTRLCSVIQNT